MAHDHVEKTSDIDIGLRDWLAQAEDRETDARQAVAPLIVGAERAGVSTKLLEVYKRGTLQGPISADRVAARALGSGATPEAVPAVKKAAQPADFCIAGPSGRCAENQEIQPVD